MLKTAANVQNLKVSPKLAAYEHDIYNVFNHQFTPC